MITRATGRTEMYILRFLFVAAVTSILISNRANAEAGCPPAQFPSALDKKCSGVSPSNGTPLDWNLPMQFAARQTSMTTIFIQATGTITPETPKIFERYLQTDDAKMTRLILLHSPGGNLLAGLQLGEIFRKYGYNTSIGHSIALLGVMDVHSQSGICVSACAYAFLGGVTRQFFAGDIYGVHRFGSLKGDVTQENAQVISSIVAKYIERMGTDQNILVAASTTSFGEDLFVVPVDLAKRMRVIFDGSGITLFSVEDRGGKAVAVFSFSMNEKRFQGALYCIRGDRILDIADIDNVTPTVLRAMKAYPAEFESNHGRLPATGTYIEAQGATKPGRLVFSIPSLLPGHFLGRGLSLFSIWNPSLPARRGSESGRIDQGLADRFLWADSVMKIQFTIASGNSDRTLPIIFRDCAR